ncbi:flap endonuclease gen homolog 1 [Nannochloropsis oceanica]
MGIAGLWACLREEGYVHPFEGVELAKHVEGKVLAIDASLWLMQSLLEGSHTHNKKHIKIVFERVIHFLMMGALPVLVFEGMPPPAKLEELERRRRIMWGMSYSACSSSESKVQRKNTAFESLATDVKKLLDALGLPYEQAVGEGEAMCALLNRQHRVDAVVSNDGDALLYGAHAVYKDLRLHVRFLPGHHRGEWLDRENSSGALLSMSSQDFLALCLLSGCDFLIKGVKKVGFKGAMEILRILQRRRAKQEQQQRLSSSSLHEIEVSLIDLLRTSLTEPVDEALVALSGGQCSTCRNCRHGTTRKEAHGAKGYEDCGTHPKTLGGDGKGGCMPAAPEKVQRKVDEEQEGASCPCVRCQRRDERTLQLLAKRAAEGEGGLARYLRKFDEARAAYGSAGVTATVTPPLAAAAVVESEEKDTMTLPYTWHSRPDFDRLKDILKPVYGAGGFGRKNLARKLLPLLLEWDARQIGGFLGQNWDGEGAREANKAGLASAAKHGFLFAPVRIERVCLIGANAATAAEGRGGGGGGEGGRGGGGEGEGTGGTWRYSMEWTALCPQAEAMVAEAAQGMRGEGKGTSGKSGERGGMGEGALPTLKDVLSEGRGCLRQTLVRAQFPGLVRMFEEEQQRKLATPSRPKKKGVRGRATAAAAPVRANICAANTLDRYFSLEGKKNASLSPFPSPPRSQDQQLEQEQRQVQQHQPQQNSPFENHISPAADPFLSTASPSFASSYPLSSIDERVAEPAVLERTPIAPIPSFSFSPSKSHSSSSLVRCPPAPRKGKRPGGPRVGEGVDAPGRASGRRNLDRYFKRVRGDGTARERESLNSIARRVTSGMEGEGGGEEGTKSQEQGNVTEGSTSDSSSFSRQDKDKNDGEDLGGGGNEARRVEEEEKEELSVIDLTDVPYIYSPAVAVQQQRQQQLQQQQQHHHRVSSDDDDENGDGEEEDEVISSPEVERVQRAVACVDLVTPP